MSGVLLLHGCFTGIESTQKIKLSKTDERALAPTPEETLLAHIAGTPYTDWAPGKHFIVVGDRGNMLFEPSRIVSGNYNLSKGEELRFRSARKMRLPDGTSVVSVEFSRGDDIFLYTPQGDSAGESVMSDAIPGVVDPELIEKVDKELRGKTLWTRSALWIDDAGQRMDGRKFVPVKVVGVEFGDMVYPARVRFITSSGESASMLMSMGKKSGGDSRMFASLFSLTDPRLSYPNISAENWEAVCNGTVRLGMTRDECRLAKGTPADVLDGRDYSHTQVIWTYGDGTVLHFVDGVLHGINALAKDY